MLHLLLPQVEPGKQNDVFSTLLRERKFRAARLLLQDAFERMAVRDPGFVKDFQGTEFDTRQFELFTSELLHEAGAEFRLNGDQPDFEVAIAGVEFAIECATANPTKTDQAPKPYRAVNPRDADMADLKDRVANELPTRFGGVLHAKRMKRIKPKNQAYWELPHTVGKPLIFAVQTFHEDGALSFSSSAISTYLYGIEHTPAWDDQGNLIIKQTKAPAHRKPNGELIPSGFFDYDGVENIAGVLWSNTGTIPKFQRMAMQGPYPDPMVRAFRVGSAGNPDPNAHAPQSFAYEVGDEGCEETWGEGCVLFHNPNASTPLPHDVLTNVSNAYIDDAGRFVEIVPAGLHPFMSLTLFGATEAEHESAIETAERFYEAINATNETTAATRAPDWYAGRGAGEEINAYRSGPDIDGSAVQEPDDT